jgi:hypothetical protein
MSPDDPGQFTDAATLAFLVDLAIHAPAGEGDMSVPEDADCESALATDPRQPRPVSSARVGLSRNAHSRPFNDPSDYLG